MATKRVVVEATLGEKFLLESKIGKHTVCIDQPEAMGGTDAGPNPLEYFLLSLAGCISAIGRIAARQKKIALRGMKIKVQGSLETDVLMGASQDTRAGFGEIEVEVEIDADLSPEEKEAFLEEIDSRCPVSDNVAGATPISLRLAG